MNNALLAIAAVLIAVLAALFAVPMFIDWNGYRGVFEEEASRIMGRDVRVGGNVDVRLLPVPYVSFGKVRIADTANDTGDPFFRADSFTMWLSVPPLLRGELEARDIELRRPVLRLAVDAQGGGNWSSIGGGQGGSLPFAPRNIALQSVRVRDGAIAIVRQQGGGLADLTAIDGALEAESLDGPFRFKGNVTWNGAPREIRLATARIDAEGQMRLKANVRITDTGNTYALDGRLSDIRRRPRLDGELTGRLGLDFAAASTGDKSKGKPANTAERPAADGKAQIEADGTGIKLKDLAASLENLGQPQILTGAAQMSWVSRPAIELRLASRLIDLDRLAGANQTGTAAELARNMAGALIAALPADADSVVGLDMDQATLGGDSVSGLSLVVQKTGDTVTLKQLKANVPGGARVDVSGAIGKAAGGAPQAQTFSGDLLLRGTSLTRFLAWAARNDAVPTSGRSDGSFMLQGRLQANDDMIEVTDGTAELGALTLSGDVRVTQAQPQQNRRRQVALRLTGHQINAGHIWPSAFGNGFGIAALEALAPGLSTRLGRPAPAAAAAAKDGAKPAAAKEAATAAQALDAAATDLRLKISTPELIAGDDRWSDVDAELALERGRLTLTNLRATTAERVSFDVSGDIAELPASPKGILRWTAAAPDQTAVAALLRIAGAPEADATEQRSRLAALTPLRLAGSLALGLRTPLSSDLVFDGAVAGGTASVTVRSDGDPATWRQAPLDLTARGEAADMLATARIVMPGFTGDQTGPKLRGNVLLKATGIPNKELTALAALDGEGLNLAYEGRVRLGGNGEAQRAPEGRALDGRWRVSARDARALLGLAGVQLGAGAAGAAINGEGTVRTKAGEATLASERLTIAGRSGSARLAIAQPAADKPPRIDAEVRLDKMTLQALLAPLTSASATASVTTAGSPWLESAFDTRVIDGLDGKLVLRAKQLLIDPGVAIADAQVQATMSPGHVELALVEGRALDAKVSAKASLQKAGGGMGLTGNLRFDKIPLDRLTGAETGRAASGTAALSADVSGQGGSPAALIAGLKGKGDIKLADAEVAGLSPAPLVALADAVLAGKAEREGEAFAKGVREALAQGKLNLGTRGIPIEVQDGVARLKNLAIDSDAGRTEILTTFDLSSLKFDTEWRIEPRLKPAEGKKDKGPLPPVSLVYAGPFKTLGTIEPKLDAGALERELTVRKMERDVEELERLRKLDEERIKAEQERQRAAEAERARLAAEQAAAAAAAAAAVPPDQAAPSAATPNGVGGMSGSSGDAPSSLGAGSGAKPSDQGKAPDTPAANEWKATSTPAPAPASASPPGNAAEGQKPPSGVPQAVAPVPRPQPAPRPKPKPSFPESLFQFN